MSISRLARGLDRPFTPREPLVDRQYQTRWDTYLKPDLWLERANLCLRSASLLLDNGDPDSACNRAYYAMFNAARGALYFAGHEELAMAKTHSGLIGSFGQHIVNAGHVPAEFGRSIGRESLRRLASDYEGDSLTEADGLQAIGNAKRFVEAVTGWIALSKMATP